MITLMFHFEVDDQGKAHWTIDSPDLPGMSANAPALRDCHRMALEQLETAGVRREDLYYVLDEPQSKAS
jgi:hypothetical protein